MSHAPWKAAKKSTFTTRLHSLDWKGISAHSVRPEYLMQYANSLVGRQLKTIAQSFVFVAYDLVPPELFSVWKAVGELTALLWMPEIADARQHQVRLHSNQGYYWNADSSLRMTLKLRSRTSSIRLH